MLAKDLMQPTTEVVHLDQNLLDARNRLHRFALPVIPVVDGDEIVGLLTAKALAQAAAAPESDIANTAVRDHMSADIAFCHPDEDVETARTIMQQGGHDHLLVIDGSGQLCGLLSADAIGDGATKETAAPGHVVKSAGRAKGGRPHRPATFSVKPIVKE